MVRPYPVHTLKEALSVAEAIQESNAGLPFDRKSLAEVIGTTPASSGFTMKLNSSARYGLTQGGYSDVTIALTPLGEAIVAPRNGEERLRVLIDVATGPELFSRFYKALDGRKIPEDAFAQNMLQREFGVHASLSAECLRIVRANGLFVGIVKDVGGSLYVELTSASPPRGRAAGEAVGGPDGGPALLDPERAPSARGDRDLGNGRIFVGSTAGPEVVDSLEATLDAFDIPHQADEGVFEQGTPLTAETSRAMRECTAAVLVFGRSSGSLEEAARARIRYLLGAASVLFGERVVLLTEGGLRLGDEPPGLRTVELAPGRLDEAWLELLKQLQETGVIHVNVAAAGR